MFLFQSAAKKASMSISEIAEKMDISVDTLRYYERIGVLPPVPRKSNGIRMYDAAYLEWVQLVKKLKASGMSLESVIDYIELAKQGEASYEERRRLLLESKQVLEQKIQELQSRLVKADDELDHYEEHLLPQTEKLMQCFYQQVSAAG